MNVETVAKQLHHRKIVQNVYLKNTSYLVFLGVL